MAMILSCNDIRNVKTKDFMTEAENTVVEEEFAAPPAEVHESDQGQHEEAEAVAEQLRETDQQINFRKMRESQEQLRKENEQYRALLTAMQQEHNKQQAASASQNEIDEFADVDPSDWTTFEQSKKVAEKIADNRARKVIEEYEAKRWKDDMLNRLRSKYSDFESVVTVANVNQLKALEPELALAISHIGDEDAKAVAAYKYIKSFIPGAAEVTASKQRIQENANRPKSLSAAGGGSPLSQASAFEQGLTPALKKQLCSEMVNCSRQA